MSTYKQPKNPYGYKYARGQNHNKKSPSIRPAGATTKDCKICGSHMNVKYFYKTTGKVCKKCHAVRCKQYYLDNKAKIAAHHANKYQDKKASLELIKAHELVQKYAASKPKTFLQKLKGLFSNA